MSEPRLLALSLLRSAGMRVTAKRSLLDSVAVVLALFLFCGVGHAQNCPNGCPADSKCLSGIWKPFPSSGHYPGPCESGSDCPSGSCVNHVCSLVPHHSDHSKRCEDDSDCPSGTCSAGHCIKKFGAGTELGHESFCSEDSQCHSGSCVLNKCVTTLPKMADGFQCQRASLCASGVCSHGECKAKSPPAK